MSGQLKLDLTVAPPDEDWPAFGSVWLDNRGRRHRVSGLKPVEGGPGELGSRCMVHVTLEDGELHIFDWWCEASFRRTFRPYPPRKKPQNAEFPPS